MLMVHLVRWQSSRVAFFCCVTASTNSLKAAAGHALLCEDCVLAPQLSVKMLNENFSDVCFTAGSQLSGRKHNNMPYAGSCEVFTLLWCEQPAFLWCNLCLPAVREACIACVYCMAHERYEHNKTCLHILLFVWAN